MTRVRAAAWLVSGLAVVLAVTGGVLVTGALWPYALACLLAVPALVLGLVVAGRRPRNVVGPLLSLAGSAVCLNNAVDEYARAVVADADVPGAWLVVPLVAQTAWMWWFVPLALVALYFPDGRLPSPRWRPVAVALPVLAVASAVLGAYTPGPYLEPLPDFPHTLGTLPDWTAGVGIGATFGLMALLVAAAVSVVRRQRTTDAVLRAQLRWLALAGMWLPVTLLLCWVSFLTLGGPDLVVIGLVGLYVSIPAATAVAILRHDLYDVDRAVSATVTYTLLGGCLVAVYAALAFTGGLASGPDSAVAAAAATAVCAVALAPVRARLQRRVDRRLHPVRVAALEAVAALRDRSRDGADRPEHLQDRLRSALRDPGLRVGYRPPGATGLVDPSGEPVEPGGSLLVPVVSGDREIGALVRGTAGSPQLLAEVADAAALLVENVCLRMEAGQALSEAESSRSRLLAAGYAERRRLERDLHDGAQQRLVSLGMALRLAQRHLDDGDVDVDGLLDSAVAELATAVAELRQIAHGLRPSCLDDGLGPALRSLTAGTPLTVELAVDVGDIPDDTATTAYYVASEAVTNAVKHADATLVALDVARGDGQLRILVRDDGRGGAVPEGGRGLTGIRDRVAAAGGTVAVTSTSAGTTVTAELPCGS